MLPVLPTPELRKADAEVIASEPIASIDLMERAATACTARSLQRCAPDVPFLVLAGMGNNGGDGLAMARMLHQAGRVVRVVLLRHRAEPSAETRVNLDRLAAVGLQVVQVEPGSFMYEPLDHEVVIDALFGSGLDRPIAGDLKRVIAQVNARASRIISIDMPSGLFAEDNGLNDPSAIIEADHVLTIGAVKLALLLPENERYVGSWELVPIGYPVRGGIHGARMAVTELSDLRGVLPDRKRFMHKGTAGHALLIAGSEGKTGAAVLAAKACARSGVGLLSLYTSSCDRAALCAAVPECMLVGTGPSGPPLWPELARFDAVAIGPGIGTSAEAVALVKQLIHSGARNVVFDADALNILAENPTWLAFLPAGSIITPHPKEFDRLAGNSTSGYDRLMKAVTLARKHRVVVVLKGANTAVCHPEGFVRFNPTGGPGMAKGGSGDALTGILCGLLAQGIDPFNAAVLGSYAHGAAGDLAAEELGPDGMLPSDLIARMPLIWKRIRAVA